MNHIKPDSGIPRDSNAQENALGSDIVNATAFLAHSSDGDHRFQAMVITVSTGS
jgi:hypothetical protein